MNITVGRRVNDSSWASDEFSPRFDEMPNADVAELPEPYVHLDPEPGFSMLVSVQKQVIEVRIAGELDLYTAFLFTMALRRLERLEIPIITVELSDLEFIDNSGMAALLEARQRADQAGRTFNAKRPTPGVRRFLTQAGQGALLDLPLPHLTPAPFKSQIDRSGGVQS